MIPSPGDLIFVPDIEPGEFPDKPFDEIKKHGGCAIVGRVQESNENLHFISVTDFGGMELRWEGFLENMQDELKKKFGLANRAKI